jgi:hypothetical protein
LRPKYPAAPRLARQWKAVDAEKGQGRFVILLQSGCPFLDRTPCTQGKGIILSLHHMNLLLIRGREPQPRAGRMKAGIFRPVCALQNPNADVLRLRFQHAFRTLPCHAAEGRALKVQGRATSRQKGGKLTPLNPADLMIICTHGKSWNRTSRAELLQVVGFAIEYHPGYARCHRCVRNLGECGSTGGFHKDAVYAGVASLNYV